MKPKGACPLQDFRCRSRPKHPQGTTRSPLEPAIALGRGAWPPQQIKALGRYLWARAHVQTVACWWRRSTLQAFEGSLRKFGEHCELILDQLKRPPSEYAPRWPDRP